MREVIYEPKQRVLVCPHCRAHVAKEYRGGDVSIEHKCSKEPKQ